MHHRRHLRGARLSSRRWVARGGKPGQISDIALWAVPFGIVGGRLYHVITDNDLYFGPGRDPWHAFFIWDGGLGIWGAVALGGLGAWIGARRQGMKMPPLADAIAPGLVLAQGIGRWGNWFNQELFGRPTTLPWGLKIDLAHRPPGYEQFQTFQPTFLYESIWDVGVAFLVIWLDRKYKIGHGRVFALYVAFYTVGRAWIEYLRIDPVQGSDVFGLRLNDWTSMVVFLGAMTYFLISRRLRPGREEMVLRGTEADPRLAGPVDGDAPAGSPGDTVTSDPAQSPGEGTRSLD